MQGVLRVFVDANVLYSRTQRDWLALIYLQGQQSPYEVYWSEDVLAEVAYHLRRRHPLWSGRKIATLRDRIAGTFEVGRVTDFEVVAVDGVTDEHDLHVHAAAVSCAADIVLTNNVRDFVGVEDYDVLTPDELFVLVDDSAPDAVAAAAAEQADYWGRRGTADLAESLVDAGCPGFAERVQGHLRWMALTGQ